MQRVGFRFFAEAQAAVEGVHGYVCNLSDGRVEVLPRETRNRSIGPRTRAAAGANLGTSGSVVVEAVPPSGRAGFEIRKPIGARSQSEGI